MLDFANGSRLLAALPVYRGKERPDRWVVTVELDHEDRDGNRREWVTACMSALEDTSWYWGHYYSDPASALADMYLRADTFNLPVAEYEALADKAVVSR